MASSVSFKSSKSVSHSVSGSAGAIIGRGGGLPANFPLAIDGSTAFLDFYHSQHTYLWNGVTYRSKAAFVGAGGIDMDTGGVMNWTWSPPYTFFAQGVTPPNHAAFGYFFTFENAARTNVWGMRWSTSGGVGLVVTNNSAGVVSLSDSTQSDNNQDWAAAGSLDVTGGKYASLAAEGSFNQEATGFAVTNLTQINKLALKQTSAGTFPWSGSLKRFALFAA